MYSKKTVYLYVNIDACSVFERFIKLKFKLVTIPNKRKGSRL